MTIVRSFWCCWGRPQSSVLATRPFRESEFNSETKNGRQSLRLDGPGVERFLEDMEPAPNSLGHCLVEMFGKYQDNVAQVNAATGEVLKYKDILAEALALAAGLRSLGVTPEKAMGLLSSPNDPKVNTILMASLILGAVLHPIDPSDKSSDAKLATVLKKEPRIVFCAEEDVDTLTGLKSSNTLVIITNGKAKPEERHPVKGVIYFDNVLKGEEGIVDLTELEPRSVLIVLQGETRSEDIVLTNEILLKSSARKKQFKTELGQGRILDYEDGFDPSWIIRKLFLFRCGGGSLIVLPPYDPENTLALVQKHRVTWVALKSSQMLQLYDCQAVVGYDLSSLQIISAPSSGSALHPGDGKKHDDLRERLPATRVVLTGRTITDSIPT